MGIQINSKKPEFRHGLVPFAPAQTQPIALRTSIRFEIYNMGDKLTNMEASQYPC